MSSRRTLGTVALISLATAAVSFGVVDVSTSLSKSCVDVGTCAPQQTPIVAISFACLGILALLVGIVPAVLWIVESIHLARQSSEQNDDQVAREHRRALHGDDEPSVVPDDLADAEKDPVD